jgi:hypothetical protein
MDAQKLLGSLMKSTFSGGRKPGKRALRALSGGSGSIINPTTLLAAAGVAWGLYEVARGSSQAGPQPSGMGSAPPWPAPGGGAATSTPNPAVGLPPLPVVTSSATLPPPVDAGLLRLVRLLISASHADGHSSAAEREQVLACVRPHGDEAVALVEQELGQPRPLREIVSGVQDESLARDLYRFGFALVRGDASVSGAERIWLAQLAHLLRLDAASVAALEADTAARIDASAPA